MSSSLSINDHLAFIKVASLFSIFITVIDDDDDDDDDVSLCIRCW